MTPNFTNSKRTIHWLGAGLSSGPGIRRIAESGRNLVLWNRTPARAEEALRLASSRTNTTVRKLDPAELQKAVAADDIVVSMLPAGMHPEIAEVCLAKGAHLVTTSYISDTMRTLHDKAKTKGLSLVNECGLDPGLDHLFAHRLVADWRASPTFDPSAVLEFRSYCGGFPKVPGPFRYQFSWSPVGVLKALKNAARYVKAGQEATAARPWDDLATMKILGEDFQVYPNRDSMPYVSEYGFDSRWNLQTFVRGTIRLQGWSEAWASIFTKIETATNDELEAMGADLWNQHAYRDGEQDRVVLYVGLEAKDPHGKSVFSGSYALDEAGAGADTAMARLVSLPATFAIEGIERGLVAPGVSGAPSDAAEATRWLDELAKVGVKLKA